jgi:hypothetical protein
MDKHQHNNSNKLQYLALISRQIIQTPPPKIFNKENTELTYTIDQMALTDIYRVFHATAAQYPFFLGPYGTFSKIDCTLGHKTSLSKYKKIKKTPSFYQTIM